MPVRRLPVAFGVLLGIACPAALAGLLAVVRPVLAEPPPAVAPGVARSETLQPIAVYDKDGKVVSFSPLTVMSMPFVRAMPDPFILIATTTPRQYLVTQPLNTKTYRGFNSCVHADIRIKSVTATAPIVTEPTAYAGVSRVTSPTGTVTDRTGLRFSRGPEPLGSSDNPMGGQDRIVSVMIVPIDGYPADLSNVECRFELSYGNSG